MMNLKSINFVFKPFILKVYGIPIIILLLTVLVLVGFTIYLVRKELSNDK